ncbi:hypothetical protein RHGRI_037604 [Rhododendron griersonianum]|uniref:Uncharacterized protein n=1 Tax=Rhododendron griersonianum TaxID=479676 RepID=A0AAV6HSE7_9ERIC|nr:hypothetical protein RHGRI_037604 [Rhododendron griersonianum]
MAKALVLLQQLTLLLAAACFTVSGNEAEGVAFSAQSPTPFPHSPIYSPSESPKYPNSQPPYPHPHEIQPPSASVKLQCNNTKRPLVQEANTDKNGYFYMMAPKSITTFGSHKCKVYLSSSPMATCNKPTDLHYGMQGAILMPQKLPQPPAQAPQLSPLSPRYDPAVLFPYELFTVGPFAFEPQTICPH